MKREPASTTLDAQPGSESDAGPVAASSGSLLDIAAWSAAPEFARKLDALLAGRKTSVCFRFRMLGEMWKPNFMHVVKVTDRGAIFSDAYTQEFVFVSDLSDIVQFEIDDRYQEFQPHFHYEVNPA